MLLEIPQLEIFDGRVIHGFSSMKDGNMAFPYGEQAQVLANRYNFLRKLRIDLDEAVWMRPCHGTAIASITPRDMGKGVFSAETAIPDVDVLITSVKDAGNYRTPAEIVNPADCAPVIVTDKNAEYLSLIHAGRRGTELGVTIQTINALANLGLQPDQLLVGIGPSICAACYTMPYVETTNPELWWNYLTVNSGTSKIEYSTNGTSHLKYDPEGRLIYKIRPLDPMQNINIDLITFNRDQLVKAGVPAKNIEIMDFCTVEQGRKGKIFSHHLTNENKEKYPEGRFMAVAQLAQ